MIDRQQLEEDERQNRREILERRRDGSPVLKIVAYALAVVFVALFVLWFGEALGLIVGLFTGGLDMLSVWVVASLIAALVVLFAFTRKGRTRV